MISVPPNADSVSGSAVNVRVAELLGQGYSAALGLQLFEASAREVRVRWAVGAQHLQPHGVVHGGVYASVVETCCSIGAQLAAPPGELVVGVENHTSFLRPVREGNLHASAVPLQVGRRAQLWECAIRDDAERLIATGRLRLMSMASSPSERAGT
jgi:1,4-dihydroxy-2-naphthoyl-CoA hydrolase